jgi:hypothetical protein
MAEKRIRVEARVDGIKAAARKIEAMAKKGGEEMVSGVRVIGEMIMTDVKASRPGAGVPKDDGPLKASGRVYGPNSKGEVALTFGGASAPYALYQHEKTNLNHNLGEARYLNRGLERFEQGGGPEEALEEMLEATIRAGKIVG